MPRPGGYAVHGASCWSRWASRSTGRRRSRRCHSMPPRSRRRSRPMISCARCARPFNVLGPLLARVGARHGVAAGRLRDRRAAGRSASEGLRGDGRRSRIEDGYVKAAALHGLKGAAHQFPIRLRRRDRTRHARRRARPGRDRAGERRARAGNRRPRQLPQRHGREDRRRRHADDPTLRASTRLHGASHRGHAGPDRSRHLRHGSGRGGRRCDA